MKSPSKAGLIGLLSLLATAWCTPAAYAAGNDAKAFVPGKFVTLKTEFTGPKKCLDIVNDNKNDQLQMAECGEFSGQAWEIVPVAKGIFQLRSQFTGPKKCLDIVNDGKNEQLTMADCGNFSGQYWELQSAGAGLYRLRTQFTGKNKCLDIVNDGRNTQLIMAKCGNFSGQAWKIS